MFLRGSAQGHSCCRSVFHSEVPSHALSNHWLSTGHYKTEVYNQPSHSYISDPGVNVLITVDETFDNDHRVVSQRGNADGRFTFSAADGGQHKICFTPDHVAANGGWLSYNSQGAVRLTLDIAIGETSKIESADKGKIQDIVQKVKDLNGRLQDIRREQVFQRVCSIFSRLVSIATFRETMTNRIYRNVKRNSVTSPRLPTLVLSDGL